MDTNNQLPTSEPKGKGQRDKDGLHKRRGYWYYSLNVNGQRRFFSTKTKNYQEARRIYQKAALDQEAGRFNPDVTKHRFDVIASKWLCERKMAANRQEISENTFRIDRERLGPLVREFGSLRICDFSLERIQQYQRERAKTVSNKTINLETSVLRQILHSVKAWNRMASDFESLPIKRRGPGRALTEEQEQKLFDTASANPLWISAYLAGLIAANTTARGCEIKRLRIKDVDLVSAEFHIWRKTTKTDAGERRIPMNAVARWAFTRLIERAQRLGATEPYHFLFPAFLHKRTRLSQAERGEGHDPTQYQKTWRSAWRSLTAAAGLKGLRFHDLRHHSITRLAEAGVPDQTIMAIAGHVSEDMLRYYSQIRLEARRAAVTLIASYSPEQSVSEPHTLN